LSKIEQAFPIKMLIANQALISGGLSEKDR